MHTWRIISITFFLFFVLLASGQERKIDFSGHIQNLNTVWIQDVESQWYTMGSVYNRLNLKYYIDNNWTFSGSARNVFNFGQLLYLSHPVYADLLTNDNGFMDLNWRIASDSSYVLYSDIDRANLQFTKGKMDVRVGRQRINWGINMVWNPNDIFNTFNFYDFDYVERPGCDAIRMQYYTGISSSIEMAFKLDSDQKITAAAMYKFNRWNYDFQLMGGLMTGDIVLGGGWSGNIGGAGFSGEGSYFRDKNNFADTTGIFVFSASANYTFKNSLFVHGSFLLNSNGTTDKAGYDDNSLIVVRKLSPKTFTQARYSLFGQVSYPLSPLISGDLSAIFNPNDNSAFVGPNVSFSLSDNISLLLMSQIFIGEKGSEFGGMGSLYYMRLKWSF